MNRYLIVLLALGLFSCADIKHKKKENLITDFLKNDDYLSSKKCLLFIPAMGCGPCTQDAIAYSKSKYKNKNILFIYTDIGQTTEMIFKGYKDANKFIKRDSTGELVSVGVVESKPVACFIKNGHIDEIVKIDDTNADVVLARIDKLIQ